MGGSVDQEGSYQARKRKFKLRKRGIQNLGKGNSKLPWHEAGPLNHPGDLADPDQLEIESIRIMLARAAHTGNSN